MKDELLQRAARAVTDLRVVAKALCDAGYPGAAIRLQGFAAYVRSLGSELDVANRRHASSPRAEEGNLTDATDASDVNERVELKSDLRTSHDDSNADSRE